MIARKYPEMSLYDQFRNSLQLQSTLKQSSFKNCFIYLIANVTFKELLDFLSPLKMPQN